jgi:thiamine biosynthesis protein ThiS
MTQFWRDIILLTVNGKLISWHPGITVEELLKIIGNKFPIVVVKVNGKHISKKDFTTYKIPDGAEIYTVDIIAGG